MYWIAFNILKNNMDAADAVMKAVENICNNIDSFSNLSEEDSKLLVSSIVKNAAFDLYRRNKKFSTQSIEQYILTTSDETTIIKLCTAIATCA